MIILKLMYLFITFVIYLIRNLYEIVKNRLNEFFESDGIDLYSTRQIVVASFVGNATPREDQGIDFGGRVGGRVFRPVVGVAPQFARGAGPGERGRGQAVLERLQARAAARPGAALRRVLRGRRCGTGALPEVQK